MQAVRFLNLSDRQRLCLEELCPELGLTICENAAVTVSPEVGDCLSLSSDDGIIRLTYAEESQLYRGLSMLPSFLADPQPIVEKPRFDLLCYMADMSRNAVYNLTTAKKMIRLLALMGYNSLMLYTEDTYEIPEFPYFGHMRGRFSKEELKELDDYAYRFGIEVIPCIQTLAHMATALRWPDFSNYVDIDDILLVGDERTYHSVELALSVCAECFRSRRINIGMDEAHNIGRGRYLTQNGYRLPADIMCEHLNRVVKMCHEKGFDPMIWSDMFFRMAFDGVYRVREGEIDPSVIAKVPSGVTLIYWDYYSLDKPMVEHMLDCHLKFDNPIAFAGGAWKWYGFGSHNRFSLKSTQLQLDVCADKNVRDVIVTSWGDNGGEASQFSPLASMLYFAERKFRSDESISMEHMEARAHACLGIGFDDLLCFDLPDHLPGCRLCDGVDKPKNPSKYLLYNDVLEGFFDLHVDAEHAPAVFAENGERLMALSAHETYGYAFETLGRLCRVLAEKCTLGLDLREAYTKGDKEALSALADRMDRVALLTDDFLQAFRRQWYRENKTFGFSCHEQRLGGLLERLRSSSCRVRAFAAGEIDVIEELEQPLLTYDGSAPATGSGTYLCANRWNKMINPGIV